ncbi:MAG: glycosyltransferase family 4 protein [Bacteroidetes bacterium]|nr:glycosyltransferase family 4 protein [Bacteroidota bacterium]
MDSLTTKQPEILINGRFLTQQVSGVQAFARSICREISAAINFKIVIPGKAKLLDDEFEDRIVRFGSLQGHLWEQLELPHFVKRKPDTVLLNLCNTGPLNLKNQVITIHDLAFRKNPNWFNPFFSSFYNFLIPRICETSKAILTVSQTIKNELTDHYGQANDKIFVVGNKVGDTFLDASESIPPDLNLKQNQFFLMVGSDDPRKNFGMIERLFKNGFHDTKLVIAGGGNRNFNTSQKLHNSEHIVITGYINEKELKWLYRNSLAFINPSLYEGFGIPNLGHVARDCSYLFRHSGVREICRDAAIYFDPTDSHAIESVLENILHNNVNRYSVISKGKGIFEEFQSKNRTSTLLAALTR